MDSQTTQRFFKWCFLISMLIAAQCSNAGTAFVHLFEWKWTAIANECEQFLGPKGFDAVQISPPNEHVSHDTWWARYQPVSYKLNSRGGTESEFQDMVTRCNNVGVKIYVDLVFNHTAAFNQGGVGSAGTYWTVENHPSLYSSSDYHTPRFNISHYNDANHVWNGKLVGLPDLNTGSNEVQNKIANYLKKLTQMGVAGFRIDAAKHMSPADIDGILSKAGRPWSFLEVIGAHGESADIQPSKYTHLGLVTEFKYGTDLASNFNGQIKHLKTLGENWGLLPSSSALIFVDNHDRERGHGGSGTLTYKDGATYNLANVYMLAYPYGYPKIMSGYSFTDTDIGPPTGANSCENSQWVCQHRWANIANMIEFRNYTVDAWTIENWWDNNNNQIAFSRGNKGFVVINNETNHLNKTLFTGLPSGEYCNVLAAAEPCSGATVHVDNNGYANFNLSGMSAVAIHGGKMADCGNDCGGFQKVFASLHFRGTPNNWGKTSMNLVAHNTWEAIVQFDGQSQQRFKFDVTGNWSNNYGDNNNDGKLERNGGDIFTTVSGKYKIQVNDKTLAYTLTKINNGNFAKNFNTLFFRGTPNNWGKASMRLVANNLWQLDVALTGQSDQRFKLDVNGDWSHNYGDNNNDGKLERTGNDIFTNNKGNFLLTVNDKTFIYELVRK